MTENLRAQAQVLQPWEAHKVRYLGIIYEGIIPSKGNAMRLTVLGFAVLAAASALGAGYITSARLPDGTTKTFQDEGARQEIQGILSQKYLKPESVKAGDNVFVTTNAAGEVTISAVTGTESDFTTNNTVLVNTIEAVAPMPGDYANVSNKAVNAFQKSGGTVTGDVTTHNQR